MQFSPIIPPPRKIAREDAENSEMLHKWVGTNAIGAIVGAIHESPADAERHRKIPRHCHGLRPRNDGGCGGLVHFVGDGVLDVPPAPAGRVAENLRFSVGRPGGRPLQVRIRRGAAIIVGVYCGTVDARSLHWVSLFVGAIHESPADAEWHRKIPRHCEEPPGDVAIRNPCGATRRPAPEGPERCGLPRP